MTKTVIEARGLGKKYQLGEYIFGRKKTAKELWALKDVSFDIKEGEAVGLIGNNGAGKSTLLKILSRITPPTQGYARVVGKVRTILEVGTGFQPELTGRENIYLNGALLGMTTKEIKLKFDEIVAFSEVENFLETPVKRYSSGMYVRLAFAVASHLNPDILIVDEVLAVGDINFQRKCLQKLDEASSVSGRTILFVSHNLTAIRTFCKRALLLQNGQLAFDGDTDSAVESFLKNINQAINLEEKNLQDRLNRTTGKVRFTRIQARDFNGVGTWRFGSGDVVNIEMSFKVYQEIPDLNVVLFIRSLDQKVITTIKKVVSLSSLKEGTETTINLQIPSLPLRSGEFGLYICFGDSQSSYNHDVIDENILPYLIVHSEESDAELRKGFFSINSEIQTV